METIFCLKNTIFEFISVLKTHLSHNYLCRIFIKKDSNLHFFLNIHDVSLPQLGVFILLS